jgi:hypothetical protein
MRWVALALTYSGLLALCLAMPKHYRQVFPRHQTGVRRSLFRLGGWLCLSASLAASVAVNGWAFGPVESVGMLAIAGLTLVVMLPYAPRIAAAAGLTGLLTASVSILLP